MHETATFFDLGRNPKAVQYAELSHIIVNSMNSDSIIFEITLRY